MDDATREALKNRATREKANPGDLFAIECEDCGWQPTIRPTVLSPECDNCGGQLVAS